MSYRADILSKYMHERAKPLGPHTCEAVDFCWGLFLQRWRNHGAPGSRLTNQTIVVEASTDRVNWLPFWTDSLPGVAAEFVDPECLNHSNRFYRTRSN